MKVIETPLPGVLIIEPRVFTDARGMLFESFSAERYREEAGIALPFVQDTISRRALECCVDCIFKTRAHRASWCKRCLALFMTWRWTCARIRRTLAAGSAWS